MPLDAYSIGLAVSVACAVLALGVAFVARRRETDGPRRLARLVVVAGLVALLWSLVSHAGASHAPGSEEALGPAGFLASHPAYPALALVSFVAWSLARRED